MKALPDILKSITKVVGKLNEELHETNGEIAKIREVIKKE
jgi:hypothetical protein